MLYKSTKLIIKTRSSFGIKEEQGAVLIARYLVEDNADDYVIFDIER